jgi:hypothetical protein
MIRAKFRCTTILKDESGNETVTLHAANGKKDTANAQWAKWTPGGQLSLTINNPKAQGKIVPGKFYFLDFSEASEEA